MSEETEKIKLTAGEFEKICEGTYRDNPEYRKYYRLILDGIIKVIIFENVIVDEEIALTNFHNNFSLSFKNCDIDYINVSNVSIKKITISSSKIYGFSIENVKSDKISIENSEFDILEFESGDIKTIELRKENILSIIRFDQKKDLEKIKIDTLFFSGGDYKETDINNAIISNLWFGNGGFENVNLGSKGNSGNLEINNLGINGGGFRNYFMISGGVFENINLNGGNFRNKFEIESGEFSEFKIIGGDFQNEFNITGGNFSEQLYIDGGKFNSFNITGGDFQTISFNKAEFKNELNIHGGEIHDTLLLQNAKYQNIEIKSNFLPGPRLFINKIEISHKTYSNTSILLAAYNEIAFVDATNTPDSVVQISNIQVNKLKFENYGNRGYITFKDFESKGHLSNTSNPDLMSGESPPEESSAFSIIRSSLGRTEFIGSNLNSFNTLRFENSNLLSTFFEGSDWPENITAIAKENSDTNKQLRIAYGQLKKVAQNQGDMLQANEYYAREMEAYRGTLPEGKSNEVVEKFTLFLNRWSNYYTTSWGYALWFTIGVTSLFYFLVCLSLGVYPEFSSEGWDYFAGTISHGIFQFFLITHDINFMEKVIGEDVAQYNSWTYLSDISGRIFISYGIYQFIQAFRKHGRR